MKYLGADRQLKCVGYSIYSQWREVQQKTETDQTERLSITHVA